MASENPFVQYIGEHLEDDAWTLEEARQFASCAELSGEKRVAFRAILDNCINTVHEANMNAIRSAFRDEDFAALGETLAKIVPFVNECPNTKSVATDIDDAEFDPRKWKAANEPDSFTDEKEYPPAELDPKKWHVDRNARAVEDEGKLLNAWDVALRHRDAWLAAKQEGRHHPLMDISEDSRKAVLVESLSLGCLWGKNNQLNADDLVKNLVFRTVANNPNIRRCVIRQASNYLANATHKIAPLTILWQKELSANKQLGKPANLNTT